MKNQALRVTALMFACIGLLGMAPLAQAQFAPGQQPVLFAPYNPPAQIFTVTAQTGTTLASSGLSSGSIQVTGAPIPTAISPVISGTTTSIATWTLGASTNTFSGVINVNVATLGNCTITIPSYTTLTAAVTLFNANTNCNSTMGLTASTSSTTFVLTQGGVSLAISNNGSTLSYNKNWTITWALQGSMDNGAHWYPIPVAAMPTTALPSTTAITETTTNTAQLTAADGTVYLVDIAGFNRFRFVTSSTVTAGGSYAISLYASSPHGLL